MSFGETFIQYYYLCQRKTHQQMNESAVYPGSNECYNQKSGDKNWMTLGDVLKVKKIADNVNFMRHFFLKSTSNYLLRRKVDFS
jgi:hypothetical protein